MKTKKLLSGVDLWRHFAIGEKNSVNFLLSPPAKMYLMYICWNITFTNLTVCKDYLMSKVWSLNLHHWNYTFTILTVLYYSYIIFDTNFYYFSTGTHTCWQEICTASMVSLNNLFVHLWIRVYGHTHLQCCAMEEYMLLNLLVSTF